jgi:hypothetical protein
MLRLRLRIRRQGPEARGLLPLDDLEIICIRFALSAAFLRGYVIPLVEQ